MVERCTLFKPLMLVVPPKGIMIACPVHPEGHFIAGSDRPTL